MLIGNKYSKRVYVTEGYLKSYVAHCLSGETFAAMLSANSTATLVLPYSAEECEVCGEATSARDGVVALVSGEYTIKVKR